jgi:hypothetical protein
MPGPSRLLRPSALLRRRFIVNGVMGGNRKWLILGGAAWFLHYARRILFGSDPVAVYTEELAPGEKLVITHIARPEKRRR